MSAIARRLRCELLEGRRLMAGDLEGAMQLSIEATQLDGLRSAEVRLQVDQSLDLTPGDVHPGDAWDGQASIVTNIDQAAGLVTIFLFSVAPVEKSGGSLVDIELNVSDALARDISAASLQKVRLNEGSIVADAIMKLDGLPVVAQAGGSCKPWPLPTPTSSMPPQTGAPLIKSNFAWEASA